MISISRLNFSSTLEKIWFVLKMVIYASEIVKHKPMPALMTRYYESIMYM